MYAKIRTIHLLLGLSTLPFLLMYGISAVQMAHSSWFNLKPRVETRDLQIPPGYIEARSIARELVAKYGLRGELRDIKGLRMRLVIPGTVHDIDYSKASGVAKVKTSVGGFI